MKKKISELVQTAAALCSLVFNILAIVGALVLIFKTLREIIRTDR